MKFFLDSANISEIKESVALGLIDGITTNPSLVAKEKKDFRKLIEEICQIVDGPISAEVVATDEEGMVEEGRSLAGIHKNVVVKVPMTANGLKATRRFAKDGIRVNVTLIFSPAQALLAAKAGATYVSPFIGRLDDVGQVGMDLIDQIVTIFSNYTFKTEVLVASIRNPIHVIEAAQIGAHVATMPFAVIQQLLKHPLTDIGLAKFLADWEKTKG
ncbi:fructose-6-phosphate aldolase [Candidatus Manganitrophus noduliformans]|uniref:Probable transaldolase n=1 Tax=Candidatus Manganitrophus noduliformans TaxID=2606439 RepID=A0A7X6DRV0_9BACT|nr:fructose-6-phosphate aldolase [Candidatus Manganitrophus noduliformans]NKE72019.1 fructose-6-phosphate aldolase [Candidatus Manganitrophus noduliformans]